MSELPYISLVVDEEIAEGSDLSNEEFGALMRVKLAMWKAGGFLDEEKLARTARAGSRWGKIAPAVLSKLTLDGGKVSSPSLLRRLLITCERRVKNAKAGKARHAKPDPALNSHNSLKYHKPTHDYAGVALQPDASNYNNNKDKSSFFTQSGNKGASKEEPQLPIPAPAPSPRDVLYSQGVELLIERDSTLNPLQAQAKIAAWLTELDAGVVAPDILARILAGADQFKFTGERFSAHVDERVKATVEERRLGASFAFPPLSIKRESA